MYPHFGTDPTYKWDMGDGTIKTMIKRYFYHEYKMAGIYNVTVTGTNNVSQQIGSSIVRVEDAISGLQCGSDRVSAVPGTEVNITWVLLKGSFDR